MIALLIALQVTTNCYSDSLGYTHCTSNSNQLPAVPNYYRPPPPHPDYGAIMQRAVREQHQKAVGKLLAAGDCAGAEQYALQHGDIELAQQVKEYCAK